MVYKVCINFKKATSKLKSCIFVVSLQFLSMITKKKKDVDHRTSSVAVPKDNVLEPIRNKQQIK